MTTRIITPPAIEPLTIEEVKVNLNIDHSDAGSDADLLGMIAAARESVEGECRQSLMLQTLELTLPAFPAWCIRLERPPVIAVTSVTYTDTDGASVVLDPSAYTLDNSSEPPRLVPTYGTTWPAAQASVNAVRVRYTAGYSDSIDPTVARAAVPYKLKRYIHLLVGDQERNRTASAEKPTVRHDFARGLLFGHQDFSL
jgi:uncharacterized phiE125 gp8 family phage protein